MPRNQAGGAKYMTGDCAAKRRCCAGSDNTSGSARTSPPIIALLVMPVRARVYARGTQTVSRPFTAVTARTANTEAAGPEIQNAIAVRGGASTRQRPADINSTIGVMASCDATVKSPAKSASAVSFGPKITERPIGRGINTRQAGPSGDRDGRTREGKSATIHSG